MTALPEKLPHWLPAALFCLALGAAFWHAPAPAQPGFALPSPATAPALPALFASSQLPRQADIAGDASPTWLADGRLAVAWMGGSQKDSIDNGIWFSILEKTGWTAPTQIANAYSTAGGTFARSDGVDKPLLHADGATLYLWYVSLGWPGSAICHSLSADGGETWSKPTRLQTLPLTDSATRFSGQPVPLGDGGLALPLSHGLFSQNAEWLRLAADGRVVDKTRLTQPRDASEPAVVVLDAQRAVAVSGSPGGAQLALATTADGGQSWAAASAPLSLAPNTSPALLRLPSGRLLLAGNPASGRDSLHLWLSADNGLSWQPSRTIESASDATADFSHPALLLGHDGRIHLVYTWLRQSIKYVTFSEAWLTGEQP